ncbi:MAG: DUF4349 domain-containing protein [Cytophagales bacterium]|nr:DUF4349 domain-containing protein [Rhizobacter sp.]
MRSALIMFTLAAALLLGACGQKRQTEASAAREQKAAAPALYADARRSGVAAEAAAPDAAPSLRRYLAVRHDLQIQTEPETVETAWRTANEACATMGCDVLASTLTRDDQRRPAQAQLEARVPPDKLEAFLKQVSALGSVGQHNKTAEDKTDEVIDTEARLKNMGEFRDNLRRLMATPGAKLKDLIEVERELVRVQSELDSLASRRKALAGQTDKVHVTLSFVARASVLETGVWSPVSDAVTGAGRQLAQSLAGLISFVVVVVPWGLLLALLGWGVRAVWRRRQRKA